MRHFFQGNVSCPKCQVPLASDPVMSGAVKYVMLPRMPLHCISALILNFCRPDQTLRGFIEKLLPQQAPHDSSAGAAAGGASTATALQEGQHKAEEITLDALMRAKRRITINSDEAEQCNYTTLTLVRLDESQPLLPRPFIRTLAALQLQDLRKYIADRLVHLSRGPDGGVETKHADVKPESITLYVNQAPVMGKEHTLQFVLKTQWRRPDALVMQYGVSASS